MEIVETWNRLENRDRLRLGYGLIAVLLLALAWSAFSSRLADRERTRLARETVLKELLPLKAAYLSAKRSADQLAGRMSSLRPDDSPAKVIDEIGIKGKGVKVVPIKGEERPGILEEAADVRIEGVTANEAVNLLYRLEKGSRPVMLKKVGIKVRFDDPARVDLAMTVALLKPLPGQQK